MMSNSSVLIKVKKLGDDVVVPHLASAGAAGFDLCANIDSEITILPNNIAVIPTGLAISIPNGYVGLIYPRSSMGIKENIVLANGTGVIDSDYRGEIMVALHNYSETGSRIIQPKQRIAQIVFQELPTVQIEEASELDNTERGTGGFGSTGKF